MNKRDNQTGPTQNTQKPKEKEITEQAKMHRTECNGCDLSCDMLQKTYRSQMMRLKITMEITDMQRHKDKNNKGKGKKPRIIEVLTQR